MKIRPVILRGKTYRIPTPVGTAFIIANTSGEEPFEVFVVVGKSGSDVAAMAEAIGRLISYILRMEPDRSSDERVMDIIGQLVDIGGRGLSGYGNATFSSLPDAIAKVLAEEFQGIPMEGADEVSGSD